MEDSYSTARGLRLPITIRNRDFTSGADCVKGQREKYLPRTGQQSDAEYDAHLLRTHFFSGAARMLEVLVGQVSRKDYSMEASDKFIEQCEDITVDGDSLRIFSKQSLRETWITNDSLILVDYPETPENLNLLSAEEGRYSAYLCFYRSESIKKIVRDKIGGRRQITYALLVDDDEHRRELKLEQIDGKNIYVVILWKLENKQWVIEKIETPKRNGEHLDFIPLVPVYDPGTIGAPLDNVCENNHTHYIASSDIAIANYWAAMPTRFVKGVKNDVELQVTPDALWRFESEKADAKILEWEGAGIGSLERQRDTIAADMARMGMLIESNEKSAVEATETHQLRHASSTGSVASVVHTVSGAIEKALNIKAWWDGEETFDTVKFSLSTDFTPARMDSQLLNVLSTMREKGQMSGELFHEIMTLGEIIPETVDYETERARIEMEGDETPEAPYGLDQ